MAGVTLVEFDPIQMWLKQYISTIFSIVSGL